MTLQLRTVRDLVRLFRARRLGPQNLGKTSYTEIVSALREAIEAGPSGIDADDQELRAISIDEQEPKVTTEPSNLVSSMWDRILDLTIREGTVLARRLEIHGRRETYREIAMTLEVSGERVRQIEHKALRMLRYNTEWTDALDTKFKGLREHLGHPLSLSDAQDLDPWFDKVVEYSYIIERILECPYAFGTHIITIDSVQYFASITSEEWNHILGECRKISARFRSNDITTEHYFELISNLIPECAQEFSEILWDIVHNRRHY